MVCRSKPVGASLFYDVASNRFTVQIYARAKDNGLAGDDTAIGRFYARAFAVFGENFAYFRLNNAKVLGVFEYRFHFTVVCVFIRLRAKGLHSCALADVEHTDLERRLIRNDTHFPAKRVNFTDEMSFRCTADRGVAGHKADTVEVEG